MSNSNKNTFQNRGGGRGPGQMFGRNIPMEPGQKAKDFKGSMAKLMSYLGAHKKTIVIVFILAIISTVFTILGPKILGKATDEIFSGVMKQISGSGKINFGKISVIGLWLIGLYLLSSLFAYLQGYVMSGVTMKVTFKLRSDINDKIHKLPLSYFDQTSHGEVLSRITNDVDTINQTLNQSLTQIITSITSIIGITIMMISISWQLTLVALCILPLSMIFVMMIVKKSQKHFINQQRYLGKVNGHVEEMLGNHVLVKAFSGEDESTRAFSEYNDELYKSAWRANFLSGLMIPITAFIGNIGYVAICILGGYFTANGSMTVGGIQAFIQYVRSFTQPISQIANISNILQQTAAAAERVFEFLEEKEEVPEVTNARSIKHHEVTSDVCFNHVAFGYTPEKMIIHDFNLVVKPGQKIAIVGPTGAGKSTIVNLIMRFYDVNSGEITIGGHNIKNFKRDELRSLFGMVLQDTWLFNGTIADNIRFGRLNATDDEVTNASISAQSDHFIRALPDGYNMILNEEVNNISQGQKQLITIARAILAEPQILILDEATSSVDTRTEALIQKAMDNLMVGRTSFVIAHRLSTIRNADLILCMKDGDIIEQGTHEELMEKEGFYANLYNSQFEIVK
ncbi:multidrug ABC transporter ATP-binding protein [Bacillus sp. AFS077874]|uniref:ABC transporter ATP-binding protein n=2 Tax=Bacillaceae TaxID=186817 RepID=UPI000BECF143|nr:multidrug ABC transporter ATP-binding protein [Bacillus sp. AFS096315]PFM76178.1 multidrug ABC transporter ATP-binding protein [Bacillus sp. AFS077874]